MKTQWPPLSAEAQISATLRRASITATSCVDEPEDVPVLVCDMVLAVQQAAVLSLCAVGDRVPAQAGATELVFRAANVARLPAPYTLPFRRSDRRDFDRLVTARNNAVHPRGEAWHIEAAELAAGLLACIAIIRHLICVQPVLPDLVSPQQEESILASLETIESLAEFLDETPID